MNYYEHHIGDYDSATAHLSLIEDGVYRRLICICYRTEQPLNPDVKQVYRLVRATSKPEREAVDQVLAEFFTLEADGWHNRRCDGDIDRFQKKAAHNREVGKLGGRPRKVETQQEPGNNHGGFSEEPKRNPLQTPDTSNQAPKKKTSSSRGSRRCPEDFEVTESMRSKAESDSPGVDIDRETTKFRDWEFAKARSDWPAAWRNWIREAFDRLPSRSAPTTRPPLESFRERDLRLATERVAQFTGRPVPKPRDTREIFDVEATDVTPRQLS